MLSCRETYPALQGQDTSFGTWLGGKRLQVTSSNHHTSRPLTPKDPVPSAPRHQPNRPNLGQP